MNKNQIINHIMKTPHNTNWNVLSTMLDGGNWSKLKAYVKKTPHNMNRKVLEALLGGLGGSGAVVGTAVVGRDTVSWEIYIK